MALFISQLVGQTEWFVKYAANFVELLKQRPIKAEELMVSFDVSSLFTKVPVDETLEDAHWRLNMEKHWKTEQISP